MEVPNDWTDGIEIESTQCLHFLLLPEQLSGERGGERGQNVVRSEENVEQNVVRSEENVEQNVVRRRRRRVRRTWRATPLMTPTRGDPQEEEVNPPRGPQRAHRRRAHPGWGWGCGGTYHSLLSAETRTHRG